MNNKTSYEEFWREREETLGQVVHVHSLVRVISKDESSYWGLLYATSNSIYLQTFDSHNWFDQLVSGNKKRSKAGILEIPLGHIENHELIPAKKGFLGFGKSPSQLKIIWRDDSENIEGILLEINDSIEKYLELLSENNDIE